MSVQLAVGTKSGEILIYDVAASALIDTIRAHTGAVWSLHVRADGNAMVSGSADKDVKFWEFGKKAPSEGNVSRHNFCSRSELNILFLGSEWSGVNVNAHQDAKNDR